MGDQGKSLLQQRLPSPVTTDANSKVAPSRMAMPPYQSASFPGNHTQPASTPSDVHVLVATTARALRHAEYTNEAHAFHEVASNLIREVGMVDSLTASLIIIDTLRRDQMKHTHMTPSASFGPTHATHTQGAETSSCPSAHSQLASMSASSHLTVDHQMQTGQPAA